MAEQSEPTVKDIAEAYEIPPQEVARQLQELRAEQHQAIVNSSRRRQAILAVALLCLPVILVVGVVATWLTLGIRSEKHVPSTDPPGTVESLAEQHDALGSQLYNAKQYQNAEREYLKAVQLDPKISLYHNDLGVALTIENQYAQALPQFREAVKLMPDRAIYVGNMADALLELKQYKNAASAYQAAVELAPDNAEDYRGLADSLRKLERNHEAEEAYRTSLKLAPGNANTLDGLGTVIGNQERIAEALSYFQQAIAIEPTNPQYQDHVRQAEKMLREGNS